MHTPLLWVAAALKYKVEISRETVPCVNKWYRRLRCGRCGIPIYSPGIEHELLTVRLSISLTQRRHGENTRLFDIFTGRESTMNGSGACNSQRAAGGTGVEHRCGSRYAANSGSAATPAYSPSMIILGRLTSYVVIRTP